MNYDDINFVFIHSLSLKKYQQNNFEKQNDFNHIIRRVKYKILECPW
jgi:hypothetical protein